MPEPVFLIGGGWDAAAAPLVYGPFVAAAGGRVTCLVLDFEEVGEYAGRFRAALESAGAHDVRTVVVSAARPPVPADLDGTGGVLVCGGLTPGYRDVLADGDGAWLGALRERGLPYAGFSAGAAIAAEVALVGGWRVDGPAGPVAVCDEDAGEDLDRLALLPGLGLVGVTVDVHASQWGTVPRLLHAVARGDVAEGWAIDEDTLVTVAGGTATVAGRGTAYRIRHADGAAVVAPLQAGASVRLA